MILMGEVSLKLVGFFSRGLQNDQCLGVFQIYYHKIVKLNLPERENAEDGLQLEIYIFNRK